MKWKKSLRSSFISAAIIMPLASVLTMTACGSKKPPENTFANFIKAAKGESLVKIVTQTKPKGWEQLPTGDLSEVGSPEIDNDSQTITIIVESTSKQNSATFVAQFHNAKYVIGDWKCFIQPGPPGEKSFDYFVTQAVNELWANIVAQTQPKGWEGLPTGDLSKYGEVKIDYQLKTVTLILTSKSQKNYADFIATYKNAKYQISDWVCSVKPTPTMTWAAFKQAVFNWANNISGSIVSMKELITYLSINDPKFPPDWKTMMNNPKFTFVGTQKSVDDTNHKIHYQISTSPVENNNFYTCDVLIQQSSNWGLSLSDFSITNTHHNKYTEQDWYTDQLTNISEAGDFDYSPYTQVVLQAINDDTSSKTPNLKTIFNEYGVSGLTFFIDPVSFHNFPTKETSGSSPDNKNGEIQFSIEICKIDQPQANQLTKGGIFYIDWDDPTKVANIKTDMQKTKVLQDVEIIKKNQLLRNEDYYENN